MNAADAKDIIAGMEKLGRELAVALDLSEADRYAVLHALAPVVEQSLEGVDSPEVSAASFRRVGRLTLVSLPGLRTRVQELWALLERAGVTVSSLADMPVTPALAVAFRSSEQSPASDAELLQVLRIGSFVAWVSGQPILSEAGFTAEAARRELSSEEIERVQAALRG